MAIKHRAVKVLGETGRHEEWNDDHTIDGDVDFNKHEMQQAVVENRTDWPAAPVAGQVIYRSDLTNFFGWNGTMWLSLTPVATIVVAADGTGNYTDIQDGIDALPAGGGVVYIKEGTYNITEGITLTGNKIFLHGAGFATIIQNSGFVGHLITVSGNDCMLQNLFLNAIDFDTNRGLEVTGDRTLINNCKITANGSDNLRINGASNCIITNCIITGCGNHGINLFGTAKNLIISHNLITDNDEYGILMGQDMSECVISSNVCSSNKSGISGGPDQMQITSNMCKDNADFGINISSGDRNLLMSNICLNNGGVQINDAGTNTLPNGAMGTNNLELDDLNIIA